MIGDHFLFGVALFVDGVLFVGETASGEGLVGDVCSFFHVHRWNVGD